MIACSINMSTRLLGPDCGPSARHSWRFQYEGDQRSVAALSAFRAIAIAPGTLPDHPRFLVTTGFAGFRGFSVAKQIRLSSWPSCPSCQPFVSLTPSRASARRNDSSSRFKGSQDDVHVLANLRRAVEDAGLPAHEQRLDAIGLESRKDLSDRGRDQGCVPWRDIGRTVPRCAGTVPTEPGRATLSIRRATVRKSRRALCRSVGPLKSPSLKGEFKLPEAIHC